MAAYGRGRGLGRGRGRGVTISSDGLKAPGRSDAEHQENKQATIQTTGGIDINKVSALVQGLSLDNSNITEALDATIRYANSEPHLEEILRILYIKVIMDWHSSKQMALICSKLVQIPDLGVKFRTSLLRRIQSDFGNRNEDRDEKPRTYLACMAFLCRVFQHVRSSTHEPFRPLVNPVYDGLEMLLDNRAKDTEIEVAVVQLLDVGPLLESYDRLRMRKIMQLIKGKIIEASGTKESRKLMLELIETCAAGWKQESPLQEPVKDTPTVNHTSQVSSPGSPKKVTFKETQQNRNSSTGWTNVAQPYEDHNTSWADSGWGSSTPPKNDNDAGEWHNPV